MKIKAKIAELVLVVATAFAGTESPENWASSGSLIYQIGTRALIVKWRT